MSYQALTNAPMLRGGVCLSFMAIPQKAFDAPRALEIGAEVTVRLGFCCPDILEGRITAVSDEPARAILRLGTEEWALEPGPRTEANDVPGIRSVVWRVR